MFKDKANPNSINIEQFHTLPITKEIMQTQPIIQLNWHRHSHQAHDVARYIQILYHWNPINITAPQWNGQL